jgi:hypothetical protein
MSLLTGFNISLNSASPDIGRSHLRAGPRRTTCTSTCRLRHRPVPLSHEDGSPAKRALEEGGRKKDLLLKEVDHARLRDGASVAVSHIPNAASRRSLSLRRQGELCTRPNIAGRR